MKNSLFFLFVLICLASSNFAQGRLYDNFDMGSGVRVKEESKPVSPVKNQAKDQDKLLKKTAQQNSKNTKSPTTLKNYSQERPLGKIMMSFGTSLGDFTTGSREIDGYIIESSLRYGIDPLLIYAQMHQESSFKTKALSNKGASGLMQLMPGTARRFGVTKIYDPRQNIEGGVRYMRWLLDLFQGDVALTLAGYNAGEGAVMKYGNRIPPYRETQEYVRRIGARYTSIRNPSLTAAPKKVTATEVATLEKKAPAPLTVFENAPMVVRLPDGKVKLVNQ